MIILANWSICHMTCPGRQLPQNDDHCTNVCRSNQRTVANIVLH